MESTDWLNSSLITLVQYIWDILHNDDNKMKEYYVKEWSQHGVPLTKID